jgi:hypothetical protein
MAAFDDAEISRAVTDAGSHFFDRDTMRWFGTRNTDMVDALVMIGLDTKAPEGYPRYWARVFRTDGSVERVAQAHTRRDIVREARRIAAAIKGES